jgi:septum formation protein
MINWQKQDRLIILASGSPRRKTILEQMGFTFEVIKPESIDENSYLDCDDLFGSIQRLAAIKTELIARNHPDMLILGADTIVVKDQRVMGKPIGRDDAFTMLRFLSGSKHTVITGIALECVAEKFLKTAVNSTEVFFRNISDCEIDHYLSTDEYKDKAGAYAIQGNAMTFIEKIAGCYYNVVGLPVTSTINLFKDFIDRKESADV